MGKQIGFWEKLQQFFCSHDYKIPKEYDDQEKRDKLISELKKGESAAFSRLHRCKKCKKERIIGSGIYS